MEQPPQYQLPSQEELVPILSAVQDELKKTKEELWQSMQETAKSNDSLARTNQELKKTKEELTKLRESERKLQHKIASMNEQWRSTITELGETEDKLKSTTENFKKMFIMFYYLRYNECVTKKQVQYAEKHYNSLGKLTDMEYEIIRAKYKDIDWQEYYQI